VDEGMYVIEVCVCLDVVDCIDVVGDEFGSFFVVMRDDCDVFG